VSGAVALILAAGTGERLGADTPKAFVPLGRTTMLALSVRSAERSPDVSSVVVVVPAGWERRAESLLPSTAGPSIVRGGDTRQDSVRIGLDALPDGTRVVACHDAARPFASSALFSRVVGELDAEQGADGVVPVLPIADTVKRVRDGLVTGTEPREHLALAQTPQAFWVEALTHAHARAAAEGAQATDDAALLESFGGVVRTVPGESGNFKVTTPDDLARAEAVLSATGDVGATRG
jgi:2-C-methyl-D-erythritol 4-phosphate cytidylyltransferase